MTAQETGLIDFTAVIGKLLAIIKDIVARHLKLKVISEANGFGIQFIELVHCTLLNCVKIKVHNVGGNTLYG